MPIRAVDVEGAFGGPYGYDRHLRGFVRELHRRGLAVHLCDDAVSSRKGTPSPWADPLFATLNRPVGARILLQSRMPHETRTNERRPIVNLTTFEATRVPPVWVERCRELALTVVTTDVCRDAWIASGAPPDRLRICPLGVDPAVLREDVEPLPLRLDDGARIDRVRTRFLNISAVGPRKNLTGLFRTWLRATTRQDDAVLILKLTFYGRIDCFWYLDEIKRVQRETGVSVREAAPICTILRTLRDDQMPSLFAAATHYLSLSHGEGWDLPMMEAGAMGLRLIAPAHSAYMTYLDQTVAHLLPSREIPVVYPFTGPTARLFAHTNWWEPDEDAAIAAVRNAIDGRDTPLASARERIRREFTWERATDRLVEILEEAEAMAPAPRGSWRSPRRYSAR